MSKHKTSEDVGRQQEIRNVIDNVMKDGRPDIPQSIVVDLVCQRHMDITGPDADYHHASTRLITAHYARKVIAGMDREAKKKDPRQETFLPGFDLPEYVPITRDEEPRIARLDSLSREECLAKIEEWTKMRNGLDRRIRAMRRYVAERFGDTLPFMKPMKVRRRREGSHVPH